MCFSVCLHLTSPCDCLTMNKVIMTFVIVSFLDVKLLLNIGLTIFETLSYF